jgi:hypothetical protein
MESLPWVSGWIDVSFPSQLASFNAAKAWWSEYRELLLARLSYPVYLLASWKFLKELESIELLPKLAGL